MAMTNYACYADTVEQDFIEKTCPDEWKKFTDVLGKYDCSVEHFAQLVTGVCDISGHLTVDFLQAEANEMEMFYIGLRNMFHSRTGLSLDVGYHKAEDRGDEVDGIYWALGNVYEMTNAAKKIKDEIERKSWTVFG